MLTNVDLVVWAGLGWAGLGWAELCSDAVLLGNALCPHVHSLSRLYKKKKVSRFFNFYSKNGV